jgi:hypothetical protein
VAENIRQCEVYFVCVEYLLYILGYVWTWVVLDVNMYE